jgi:nitric oxide reductase subunit B
MLAIALMVFVMREMSSGPQWEHIVKYVRISFWGLNIGLGLMLILNLFPTGVLQFADVISNGYWHARSSEFSNGSMVTTLEWFRMPADTIFILFGAAPLAMAAMLTYKNNILNKSKDNPTKCIGL